MILFRTENYAVIENFGEPLMSIVTNTTTKIFQKVLLHLWYIASKTF